MSKLPAVPDPERDKFFEPSGSGPGDNRQEYRRIADEMAGRETASHPDVQGGPVEYVNGPLMKPTYAPGSLEYAEQQRREG
jgi:hypothetical protein